MVSVAARGGKQSRCGAREEERALASAGFSLPSDSVVSTSPVAALRITIGAKIIDSVTGSNKASDVKQPTLPLSKGCCWRLNTFRASVTGFKSKCFRINIAIISVCF